MASVPLGNDDGVLVGTSGMRRWVLTLANIFESHLARSTCIHASQASHHNHMISAGASKSRYSSGVAFSNGAEPTIRCTSTITLACGLACHTSEPGHPNKNGCELEEAVPSPMLAYLLSARSVPAPPRRLPISGRSPGWQSRRLSPPLG
ncbi:hypothetical protein LIA77_00723 [Sarocladium implicatum]|nr:hypothetical protein LIA77_00723 [Sarocladium implicatum]